jgi:RNA polymerase sigma-70 factor (ECF subfamily)
MLYTMHDSAVISYSNQSLLVHAERDPGRDQPLDRQPAMTDCPAHSKQPGTELTSREQATDEQLMACSCQGDSAAFHQLIERYLARIHRFVGRLAGHGWADDLTQETFLRAYERRTSFRPGSGSVCSWLHTIARNLAIDFHRRRRHAPRISTETEQQVATETPPTSPLDCASDRELLSVLEREVLSLHEPFRSAVVLCLFESLSYEEAAAICGCPVKTISSRLARGRAQLRERLERWRHQDQRFAGTFDEVTQTR